jgi:ribonucleoside-diphosphate reductase alpha chain/ribonucleoside-triphosphate reductase
MTNVTLELPHWDTIQKRDRLTGVSLTGYVEAMDSLGVDTSDPDALVPTIWGAYRTGVQLSVILQELNEGANFASVQYASEMRIPSPLLVTTV